MLRRTLALVLVMSCAHVERAEPSPPPMLPAEMTYDERVRCAESEAKLKVAENAGIPAWAVILLVGAGMLIGGGAMAILVDQRLQRP